MPNVKTAISIEQPLFEELESLARELDVSRSRLFALAAREFLERRRNQKLLEAINAAQEAGPNQDDQELLAHMQAKHRSLVRDEW